MKLRVSKEEVKEYIVYLSNNIRILWKEYLFFIIISILLCSGTILRLNGVLVGYLFKLMGV